MADAQQSYSLPRSASRATADLILKTFRNWEVGVGNAVARDSKGAPVREESGELSPVTFDPAHDDLVGPERLWKACDEGFPIFSGGAIVAQATFQHGEANFDITETGLRATDPATGQKVLFSRVPKDQGTKRGGTWRALIELVL